MILAILLSTVSGFGDAAIALNKTKVDSYSGSTQVISNTPDVTTPKSLEPVTETPVERCVRLVLTVDNSHPEAGEEITFTLTITNDGDVSYTDMKVTWAGQEMNFPTSRLNPGDSVSATYKLSFTASTTVRFNVSMKDHKGDWRSVNSNEVRIELPVDPEALLQNVFLCVKADRTQLTSPSEINFSGYVTNTSNYTLSNVTVTEATIGTMLEAATMAPGEKINIQKALDIDATTTYEFVLRVYDRNGQAYRIASEPITVSV